VQRRRRGEQKEPAKPKESPALRDRISHRTSARTRRAVTFLLGLWCGGLLLVALTAPASFRAADRVMAVPPPALEQVLGEEGGKEAAREILRYQVGEVNRMMFAIWGWMQLGASLAVLGLLLFLSRSGRLAVGVAAGMVVISGVLHLVLIPRIAAATRASALKQTGADAFALLHGAFGVFQLALLMLMAMLLFLLFRRRGDGSSGRG
jgi:hypothetical protein